MRRAAVIVTVGLAAAACAPKTRPVTPELVDASPPPESPTRAGDPAPRRLPDMSRAGPSDRSRYHSPRQTRPQAPRYGARWTKTRPSPDPANHPMPTGKNGWEGPSSVNADPEVWGEHRPLPDGSVRHVGSARLTVGTTANTGSPRARIRMHKPTVHGALDGDFVRRIVRAHLAELRHCYARARETTPTLAGRVELRFTIGGDGSVAEVRGGEARLDAELEECFGRSARRWKFPRPRDGQSVDVVFPLQLEPPRSPPPRSRSRRVEVPRPMGSRGVPLRRKDLRPKP